MGTTIDALLDEKKRGYAPFKPLVPLYTKTGDKRKIIPVGFDVAVGKVRSRAKKLIEHIENKAKTPIAKFTIGKTYSRQMVRWNFDPTIFDTWIKKGIQGRWKKKYEKEGCNGVVVLCGITRELLPLDPNKRSKRHSLQNQQQYALALEQQLIHYFLFEAPDSRLGNDSLDKGKLGQIHYAGVVYLAFKLYTVREVWQLFQDAFELKVEPDDTVFVINMSNGQPNEDQTKIIGGPRAENGVIAFVKKERFRDDLKKIRIFVNYIPSNKFVQDLVDIEARNQQASLMLPNHQQASPMLPNYQQASPMLPNYQQANNTPNVDKYIIIARNLENATKSNQDALEMLLNNHCAVREFEENDWNDLAKKLQLHIDGISPQRDIELEEFKTYLEKPKDEILEMFHETEKVFVISDRYVKVTINGRNVENRVIRFLKYSNTVLDRRINMYANYDPSKRFEKLLKKTVKESKYLKYETVQVGSEAMAEAEKQKQKKKEIAEPNDSVFVIRDRYEIHVVTINGRNVENRVIRFLKYPNTDLDRRLSMYVNYNPSKKFENLLKKTVKESEDLEYVKVLVVSEDDIDKELTVGQGERKVKIKTMTISDLKKLEEKLG